MIHCTPACTPVMCLAHVSSHLLSPSLCRGDHRPYPSTHTNPLPLHYYCGNSCWRGCSCTSDCRGDCGAGSCIGGTVLLQKVSIQCIKKFKLFLSINYCLLCRPRRNDSDGDEEYVKADPCVEVPLYPNPAYGTANNTAL